MINIHILKENITDIKVDLLIVTTNSNKRRSFFGKLDKAFEGKLHSLAVTEKFEGKQNQFLSTPTFDYIQANRLLLVGVGENADDTKAGWLNIVGSSMRHARSFKPKSIAIVMPSNSKELEEQCLGAALGASLASYRFEHYKSKKEDTHDELEISLLIPKRTSNNTLKELQASLHKALILAGGIYQARDLVNEPASVLTPKELAKRAKKMAELSGLQCEILTEKEMKKLGMGMFLAVASGSTQKPRLIHLIYKPKHKINRHKPVIALVGKGVTFDSGGLSLKPSASMLNMHGDMAGSAAVFGTMQIIAALQAGVEVHGYLAATENMTGGAAYKLNDVLRAYNNKTVEVHNTDAEGRLVLGDTLAYACDQGANEVIDIATLTGACIVALGNTTAGIMGNDQEMIDLLINSGKEYDEPIWQLPLIKELRKNLDSPIADLKNVGGRYGGAITAGLFLQEFIQDDVKWVHLDIAGPSHSTKSKAHISEGGTGFAVSSLVQYILAKS